MPQLQYICYNHLVRFVLCYSVNLSDILLSNSVGPQTFHIKSSIFLIMFAPSQTLKIGQYKLTESFIKQCLKRREWNV